MNTKRKTILFLITIITLLITLTCINATDNITTNTTTSTDNTDNINHETPKTLQKQIQSDEKTNNKKIIINKNTTTKKTPKTYTQYAYGYQDLYNKVQSTKNNYYSYNDVSIYLQQGNYNITQPINWGNSNTKTLKIYANNQLFDAQNQTNFITVEKGYTLELHNFKIRYAEATRGSVIYNKGTVNIYDSIFLNSTASSNGGVIYNDHGKVKILNSSFSNNQATNGACIYNNNGTVNLTKNYFSFNKAQRGGVNYNIGELNITSSTFKNNQATQNGGCNYNDKNTLTILKSNFQNNKATKYGGVNYNNKIIDYNYDNAPIIYFNESQATGNYATNGGVDANYGELTIKSSNLNNNSATRGGVNYNFNYIEIIKSTFKNNYVTVHGGVNYNDEGSDMYIIDSTFINNTAKENGGVNYNNKGIISLTQLKNIQNTAKRGGVNYNDGRYIFILDSNFTANKAILNGGVNYNNNGLISMSDCISTDNTAQRAANTYNNKNGELTLKNSTFKNEKATYDADIIINYGTGEMYNNTFIQTNYKNSNLILSKDNIEKDGNIINLTNNTKIKTETLTTFKSPVIDSYTSPNIYLHVGSEYIKAITKNSDNTAKVTHTFKTPGIKTIELYYGKGTYDIFIKQEVIGTPTTTSNQQTYNVNSYTKLVNAFNNIKSATSNKEYIINIQSNIKINKKIVLKNSESTRKITIKGNNHIIDGQNKTRFIDVGAGFTLNIENLKIQNCQTPDEDIGDLGGASFGSIGNNGTLNIKNLEFKNNYWCGAIVNNGILSVEKTKFVDMISDEIILNSGDATAKIHYSNFTNDNGCWSLIENSGDLYIDHSIFNKNNISEFGLMSNYGYINLNYNNFTNNRPGYYPEIAIIRNYEDGYGGYPYGHITDNIFRNNYFRYYVDDPYYSLTLSGNIFD